MCYKCHVLPWYFHFLTFYEFLRSRNCRAILLFPDFKLITFTRQSLLKWRHSIISGFLAYITFNWLDLVNIIMIHWLPISQRIQYRVTAMVSCCVLRSAPSYLCDLCCPVSVLAARRVIRSAARGELLVPRAWLAIRLYAAKCLFGCGSISMEWSPIWAAVPSDGPPFKMLHLSEVLLLCPWLHGVGAPRSSSSLLKRRYISLQNEWMNEWMIWNVNHAIHKSWRKPLTCHVCVAIKIHCILMPFFAVFLWFFQSVAGL